MKKKIPLYIFRVIFLKIYPEFCQINVDDDKDKNDNSNNNVKSLILVGIDEEWMNEFVFLHLILTFSRIHKQSVGIHRFKRYQNRENNINESLQQQSYQIEKDQLYYIKMNGKTKNKTKKTNYILVPTVIEFIRFFFSNHVIANKIS